MKKIMRVALLFFFCLFPTYLRANTYIGLLGSFNFMSDVGGEIPFKDVALENSMGIGFLYGGEYDIFRLEAEIFILTTEGSSSNSNIVDGTSTNFQSKLKDSISAYMLNILLQPEILTGFKPYIGVGLGFSSHSFNFEYQSESTSKTSAEFIKGNKNLLKGAYAVITGFDLDISKKVRAFSRIHYASYGGLEYKLSQEIYKMRDSVAAMGLNIGAIYLLD